MTNLQDLRKKKGLSQRQLAEKSCVSIRMIQKYEQGSKDINKARLMTAVALAKALKCMAEDLIQSKEI